jgi:hypothetical protein
MSPQVAALKTRTDLCRGDTVLVNGATWHARAPQPSAVKHLGALRGHRPPAATPAALQRVAGLGAKRHHQPLDNPWDVESAAVEQFGGDDGVDVILDYLYGQWARNAAGGDRRDARPHPTHSLRLHQAVRRRRQITLPSAVMRSAHRWPLMGSGIGSAPERHQRRRQEARARPHNPPGYTSTQLPSLANVNQTWNTNTGKSGCLRLSKIAA